MMPWGRVIGYGGLLTGLQPLYDYMFHENNFQVITRGTYLC